MYASIPLSRRVRPLLLVALLPLAAFAAPAQEPSGALSASLAEAREEVRRELAGARIELETGNLELGQSLRFGTPAAPADATRLPRAEITPAGDFLVDGQAVAIDPQQRRQLLETRGRVIAIAVAGIGIGEQAAEVALASVDRGLFSLLANAMTGRLERQLQRTLRTTLEPGIVQLCGELPALFSSQQALVAGLPAFEPWATLREDEVHACESDLRREFASL